MRRALTSASTSVPVLLSTALALVLAGLLMHHHAQIVAWAASTQREFQNALAHSLRALRTGEPGATAGLMGLCLGYGFVHAVGPGHGKVLVGAYSAARPIGLGRLAAATVLASLGQAVTAVVLVLGGVGLFAVTRQQLTTLAETTLTQLSLASILVIGLWLVWRGTRRAGALIASARPAARRVAAAAVRGHEGHHHDHHTHDDHHDPNHCAGCGHAHAPTPEASAEATGWRELASLILAIAIRPCSGAILLLLTWQMGILPAGIAGAFAMATGTAALTLLVAVAGTGLRRGALVGLGDATPLRAIAAGAELLAGLAVALLAAEGLGLV